MQTVKRIILPLLLVTGLLLPQIAMASAQDNDKPTIRIGSKQFTEQIILAEMYALILEDAGYPVERSFNLGGTAVVHQALINDELDMYLEYTGTALTAILGEEVPVADGGTPVAQTTYDIVADAYREQFDLVWLDELGLNNTYTITVRQETADELGIGSISDLEGHAEDMTLGSDQEFPVRPDGLPGLQDTYGIEFGDVKILDAGLMYSALDKGQVDAITGYATDGRIPALGLVILEDDKDFFPPYFVAPVIRGDVLEENPELEELLNQLAGKIDDETMAELNRQVDEDGEEATDVARAFLIEQGILEG